MHYGSERAAPTSKPNLVEVGVKAGQARTLRLQYLQYQCVRCAWLTSPHAQIAAGAREKVVGLPSFVSFVYGVWRGQGTGSACGLSVTNDPRSAQVSTETKQFAALQNCETINLPGTRGCDVSTWTDLVLVVEIRSSLRS